MVTALGSLGGGGVEWLTNSQMFLSLPCNRNVDTYRGQSVLVPGNYKEGGIGVQGKL